MEIIRFADLRPQPWRNGGGVTRELVSHPLAASTQNGAWDWRVSIADITKAGDFSPFPGMERVLTVVEGELLLLTVDGDEHPLEKYRPFRFSGDAACSGALPTGDIRNLNVITRTGAFKGYTSIVELSKKRAHPVFEGQLGILLAGPGDGLCTGADGRSPGGTGATRADGSVQPGDPRHSAVMTPSSVQTCQTPEVLGRGFLAVVSIDPAAGEG